MRNEPVTTNDSVPMEVDTTMTVESNTSVYNEFTAPALETLEDAVNIASIGIEDQDADQDQMDVDDEYTQRPVRCGFKSDRHHKYPETLINQPNQYSVRPVSRLSHLKETRPFFIQPGNSVSMQDVDDQGQVRRSF